MTYQPYERVRNLNRLEALLKEDARFSFRDDNGTEDLTSDRLLAYALGDLLNAIRERRLTTLPPT